MSEKIPADDLTRALVIRDVEDALHLGLVGDTYTVLLNGEDTAGRYCLIDMHVPPGGGPPPHRHDFEETFTLLEGELEFTFRGKKMTAKAGETVHVPANAPHQFHNGSKSVARMLCICAPAGQERFFEEVGVQVATRTQAPPKLDGPAMEELGKKVFGLAPKYKTELL
ncbi:cupin domain-containing protein [Edaphobacter albus]|uniref:cupin domain-containing protein n=1 Tax=Edaphobacter sp. 4G125 TaxID=2763071 RepID=UPI001646D143|nr:cupin domain-containing protein [Edaphobacter sp. 4G125]QNI38171.1 cupin domain-containing protein [Edaphobacter sp. 4G125]